MIKRIYPYPFLAFSLILMWLFLTSFTLGQFIISLLVSIVASQAMKRLDPEPVKFKNWHLLFVLFFRLVIDITKSNLAVAWIIITNGKYKSPSGFIIISLHLRNRKALAILSCILTVTPGTAWIAYNRRTNELLMHILDLNDEKYWQNFIADRYEILLLRMLQPNK